MAQNTPATIAINPATSAKSPFIKPLTAAKSKITARMISKTFILNNLCKSTSYFYNLKMHIVSLPF